MKTNPKFKEQRKGKKALEKLLKALNNFDTDRKELLNMLSPDYRIDRTNMFIFNSAYENCKNIRIANFKIGKTKLLNSSEVFGVEVDLIYDCSLPSLTEVGDSLEPVMETIEKLSISTQIRIAEDSAHICFYPVFSFVNELYNNALKHRLEQNKT